MTCEICLEDVLFSAQFTISSCSHRFCRPCMAKHAHTKIMSRLFPIACPHTQCKSALTPDESKQLLDPKSLAIFTVLEQEAAIPDSSKLYCPFPDCARLMSTQMGIIVAGRVGSAPKEQARCRFCRRLLCTVCRVAWHVGLSCAAATQTAPLQERQRQDADFMRLAKEKNWRKCQRCRRMIELQTGCFHITCRCGFQFCYVCGDAWKGGPCKRGCVFMTEENLIGEGGAPPLPLPPPPALSPEEVRERDIIQPYKAAIKPLQFRQVAGLQTTHHFRQEINLEESETREGGTGAGKGKGKGGGGGVGGKARTKRMVTEIASLKSDLPLDWASSIFMCVDESRMDVLSAAIVGPHGTPYENGIFLFDIFLPLDYPDSPPNVFFLTTAGGTVRFNPNLYQSGRVCLSLLGTWDGPSWDCKKSSLLQVLISLQALVLVEKPYYNEPGFDESPDKGECEEYSQQQRFNTIRHALLPSLRSPPPHFAPVLKEHFARKRGQILETCQSWLAKTSDLWASQMKMDCAEVARLLDKNYREQEGHLISPSSPSAPIGVAAASSSSGQVGEAQTGFSFKAQDGLGMAKDIYKRALYDDYGYYDSDSD